MNRKGQALVEFVIIMPIFIFIVIAVFDISNIIMKKYELENDVTTVSALYEEGKEEQVMAYVNKIDAKLKYDTNDFIMKLHFQKKLIF